MDIRIKADKVTYRGGEARKGEVVYGINEKDGQYFIENGYAEELDGEAGTLKKSAKKKRGRTGKDADKD